MPRLLIPFALTVAALPCRAQERVLVEGLSGRVETLSDSARVELVTGLGLREYAGAGHLESGALSHARIAWRSRASLELHGRTGLEWMADGVPELHAFELERGDLEVRRGPLHVVLPGGWHASFGAGAFRLGSQPGGALEIETVAGEAPRVWWTSGGALRVVQGAEPGERVVLGVCEPPRAPVERERWHPWPAVSWPWGEPAARVPSIEPSIEPPVVPAAAPEVPAPRPAPEPAREALILPRVVAEPAREAEPEPGTELAPEAAPASEPVAAPEPAPEAPPAPSAAPAAESAPTPAPAFDPAQWGGHAREELVLCGALATERRSDLVLESTTSGCFALRLRSDAPTNAHVFRAGTDLELLPGTLALFDAEGRLFAELGRVLEHPAPPARPAPAAAGLASLR